MAMLNQCYSMRGLEVVSACNISSTVSNLFLCAALSMGNTVAIIVGQLLGAGELERAVDEDRKLIAFSVALSTCVGIVMALLAPLLPQLYNTSDSVKQMASDMLWVSAAMMPFNAFTNTCYFTLRSGGKTIILHFRQRVHMGDMHPRRVYALALYHTADPADVYDRAVA